MIIKVVKILLLLFLTYISVIFLVDIGDDLFEINRVNNDIKEKMLENKDLNQKYEEFIESHR